MENFNETLAKLVDYLPSDKHSEKAITPIIKQLQANMQQAIRDNEQLVPMLSKLSTQLQEIAKNVSYESMRKIMLEVTGHPVVSTPKPTIQMPTTSSWGKQDTYAFLRNCDNSFGPPEKPLPIAKANKRKATQEDSESDADSDEEDNNISKRLRLTITQPKISAADKRTMLFDTATGNKRKFSAYKGAFVAKSQSGATATELFREIAEPLILSWSDVEKSTVHCTTFQDKLNEIRDLCKQHTKSTNQAVVTMLVNVAPRLGNL